MSAEYTDPSLVEGHRVTAVPTNPYRTGYGPKIPTRHMILYAGRWRRVYVMVYGNSGSSYVVHEGREVFIDTYTEHKLEERA